MCMCVWGGDMGEYRWQYIFEWDDSYVNVF